MGTTHTYLPDAARAGAKFITEFTVDSLTFSAASPKTVTGISGVWGASKTPLIVPAKRVIVSGGSLHSPALLLRSGLTNPQIGKNLHIHPGVAVFAEFEEDVSPYYGSPITTYCSAFNKSDGMPHPHGPTIETLMMTPGSIAAIIPWSGAKEFQGLLEKWNHMATLVTFMREAEPGRIEATEEGGRFRIVYTPSAKDRETIMVGVITMAQMAYLQGAIRILSPLPAYPPFIREKGEGEKEGVTNARFKEWIDGIKKKGIFVPGCSFGSAHQMGSNRMSVSEDRGVVDPQGRVWGTKGLWVADASVMPTACGVNSMVTTMAIALQIAKNVVKDLDGGSA